ncbi:MAG: efflux transporter, family, subunit [Proteobacteria bacterium]|nr:efflux transporter, family, subunit [Pseudomonadota bacterium]
MLATLLVLLVGVVYWHKVSNDKAAEKMRKTVPPVPVTAARAQTRDIPILLEAVGRAEAYESVTLKARVDGQVLSVVYTEGQHVKPGDVLVRLDPNDYAARLTQSEANLARSVAQQAKARADLIRYLSLKERGFVSEEKVNEFRTAEAAVSATVRADKAALELVRLQHSYTTVRSPIAGIVGARLVSPGAGVKVNDTTLAVVNRVQPLYVTFAVAEKHLPILRRSLAKSDLKAIVGVPGDKSQRFEAEVKFIDNAVDASTGMIQMKALLENKEEKLTAGQFLNVSLALETLPQAVVVPAEAVQQGVEGNFLFVVKADQTVETRKVTLNTTYQGLAAIGQGVAVGETVVTDGQLRLTQGAMVQVKTVQPVNGAASTRSSAQK